MNEKDLNSINSNKITIIKAWDIRCPKAINLYGNQIRKLLEPTSLYIDNAKLIINSLREKYDCLIGVHARRGDYKQFLNGLHFHCWQSYKEWIFQLKKLFRSIGRERIGFLICSDEKPNRSILYDSCIKISEGNHYLTDLHALSLCDYLVGPPSSFGTWISWHGKSPRCIVNKNMSIESLKQFNIVINP